MLAALLGSGKEGKKCQVGDVETAIASIEFCSAVRQLIYEPLIQSSSTDLVKPDCKVTCFKFVVFFPSPDVALDVVDIFKIIKLS